MKDISDTGARIEISDAHLVPDQFTVLNELDGYNVDVTVIRREGNILGVEFSSPRQATEKKRVQYVGMVNLRPAGQPESSQDNQPVPGHPDITPRAKNMVGRSKPTFGTRK